MTEREIVASYLLEGLLEAILDKALTVHQVREWMKIISAQCDIPELRPEDVKARQNNYFVFS